jgi:hypothetical protein
MGSKSASLLTNSLARRHDASPNWRLLITFIPSKENVQLSNWGQFFVCHSVRSFIDAHLKANLCLFTVSKQRQDYKLLQLRHTSRLTEKRRKLLNEIGFVWEIARKGRRLRITKPVQQGIPSLLSSSTGGGQGDSVEGQSSSSTTGQQAEPLAGTDPDGASAAQPGASSTEMTSLEGASTRADRQELLSPTAAAPTQPEIRIGTGVDLPGQGASAANVGVISQTFLRNLQHQQRLFPSWGQAQVYPDFLGQLHSRPQHQSPLGPFLASLEQPRLASMLNPPIPGSNLQSIAAAVQLAQQGQRISMGSIPNDPSLLLTHVRARQMLAGQHVNPIDALQHLRQNAILQDIPSLPSLQLLPFQVQ